MTGHPFDAALRNVARIAGTRRVSIAFYADHSPLVAVRWRQGGRRRRVEATSIEVAIRRALREATASVGEGK